VTTTLTSIAGYDWKGFFVARLNATGTDRAPLEGLTSSGWTLAYGDAAGSVETAREEVHHTVEERFSLDFLAQQDGTIVDVLRDSPAWKAGLGPGMKLLTVDGQRWSARALRHAIAADRNRSAPISLAVQNGLVIFPAAINDHRGARYPRVERNTGPDLMSLILTPRIIAGVTP
jgi:predicted metalloprotease with PDZ domain